MITSRKKNQALENINNKPSGILNDRDIKASYLLSPLSKFTEPENITKFKLVKDSNSKRVIDLLIHNSIPVTLQDNLLTFCDTGKIFELKADVIKIITNRNYNVNLARLSDIKSMYDFAKEMYFDVKGPGNKSTPDRTLTKLIKSPAFMASGISSKFSPADSNELCDRLGLLQQEKQAGNNSNKIDEDVFAIVEKLLQYVDKKTA